MKVQTAQDVRQPWGTRKAPGAAKRSLGYKETPLPAPEDTGPAVRIVTSKAATASGDGAAPPTVALRSDAAAAPSKVSQEAAPDAAFDDHHLVSSAFQHTACSCISGPAELDNKAAVRMLAL